VITSDGDKVSNPKHFQKHYQRLRKDPKNLSRKQKGSKNREKARIKVARIHAQITDSRKDHLHKLTTQLVRENQTINDYILVTRGSEIGSISHETLLSPTFQAFCPVLRLIEYPQNSPKSLAQ
jgi:hypothetical protein